MSAIPSGLIFLLHRKKKLSGQAKWQILVDPLLTLRANCRRVSL
jgi:hypothetical protein